MKGGVTQVDAFVAFFVDLMCKATGWVVVG